MAIINCTENTKEFKYFYGKIESISSINIEPFYIDDINTYLLEYVFCLEKALEIGYGEYCAPFEIEITHNPEYLTLEKVLEYRKTLIASIANSITDDINNKCPINYLNAEFKALVLICNTTFNQYFKNKVMPSYIFPKDKDKEPNYTCEQNIDRIWLANIWSKINSSTNIFNKDGIGAAYSYLAKHEDEY